MSDHEALDEAPSLAPSTPPTQTRSGTHTPSPAKLRLAESGYEARARRGLASGETPWFDGAAAAAAAARAGQTPPQQRRSPAVRHVSGFVLDSAVEARTRLGGGGLRTPRALSTSHSADGADTPPAGAGCPAVVVWLRVRDTRVELFLAVRGAEPSSSREPRPHAAPGAAAPPDASPFARLVSSLLASGGGASSADPFPAFSCLSLNDAPGTPAPARRGDELPPSPSPSPRLSRLRLAPLSRDTQRLSYLGFSAPLLAHVASSGRRTITTASVRRWLISSADGVKLRDRLVAAHGVASFADLQIDHVVAVKWGGVDHPFNYFVIPASLNASLGSDLTSEKEQLVGRGVARVVAGFCAFARERSGAEFSSFSERVVNYM